MPTRKKLLLIGFFGAFAWWIVAPLARPVTPEVAGSSPVAPALYTSAFSHERLWRMMTSVPFGLPSGTVTFLFSDVEGSTKLLHELGAEAYAQALTEHRHVLREAFVAHGGVEVDTQGDAFFVAFASAPAGVESAEQAVRELSSGPIRVRIGIHTGTPHLTDEGYVGIDVHRAARIAAAGHGGQVLLSASTAALVGSNGLRDLGEHRLKDLTAPERIYQLGDGTFPPLRTLYRTNLPIPATPFLGRERELAEVSGLLSQDAVRLLTLTGPGGTGKTRLGLQAAAAAAEVYPDGVFWVPLAPLRDPQLVLESAVHALGAKDGLAEHIADKSLLLLFDNFEHLVDAAVGLSELLASCPNLVLLVTSRELLRLPGEQAYPVPPLDSDDGTDLFVARARAVEPDFEPDEAVAELCARLDNLPLALELAAARVRILTPTGLLERLSQRLDLLRAGRSVDARQQTLRATIEWSHDLLDEAERRLFARLAVFDGGCTIEAAEVVCDADIDTFQSLVDKSLLRVRDGDRFWMLETIREFALEQLGASGEAEQLRRRHAEYFLEIAERAEAHLRNGDRKTVDSFDRDHDNVRLALDAFEASGETELALRLVGAVFWYWGPRGYVAEGRRRIENLLSADVPPTPARAKALNAAAHLTADSGDAAPARRHAEAALALNRELGDRRGEALSLSLLGNIRSIEADLARNDALPNECARLFREAQTFLQESIELFDELHDEHWTLMDMYQLAYTQIELGDDEHGRALRERILVRARAASDEYVEALTLGGLVRFAFAEDRLEDALSLMREAIRIWVRFGELSRVAILLGRFAYPLARTGRAETATRLLARSAALFEEIGQSVPWTERENKETLATIRSQLDRTAFDEAWQQGQRLTVEEAVSLAVGDR